MFSSHFRVHGIGPREPWQFGDAVETMARQWFELRYQLLGYLKHACDEAHGTGLPVMRAMALAFPQDPVASQFELQFLCGDDILVMPVLNDEGTVSGWLPQSPTGWVDAWTGIAMSGGQAVSVTCDINRIPLFLRGGATIALAPLVQSTGEFGIGVARSGAVPIAKRVSDFKGLIASAIKP